MPLGIFPYSVSFEIVIACILLFQEWMEAIKKFCGKVMNTTVGERDVKQLRSLEVNVVEAHSSNKVSHPYCMISLNEVKTCRTKTQEGHSPIWNEEFKFKWVNWFWIWQHTFAFLRSSITVEPVHNGHLAERFKQESMCGLSAKKAAVEKKWPLAEVRLYYTLYLSNLHFRLPIIFLTITRSRPQAREISNE